MAIYQPASKSSRLIERPSASKEVVAVELGGRWPGRWAPRIIGRQRGGCEQQLRIERGRRSAASTAIGSLKIFARGLPPGLAAAISDRDRRAKATPPLPPNCCGPTGSAPTTCSQPDDGYFPLRVVGWWSSSWPDMVALALNSITTCRRATTPMGAIVLRYRLRIEVKVI